MVITSLATMIDGSVDDLLRLLGIIKASMYF